MTGSAAAVGTPTAVSVAVTGETLTAALADGRGISVPLAWYPRLLHASPAERDRWELSSDGQHVHWPGLDEDIGVEGLLAGWRSDESEESLRRWIEAKHAGRPLDLASLFPERAAPPAAGEA